MRVNNINGTSQNFCKCGSWLNHWQKFSGQPIPTICPVLSCHELTAVGAHVQKDNSTDKSWYIIPLCRTCNAKAGSSLDVLSNVVLVSANVSETCGK